MERHQTTGRVGMGFGLACTTMLLWGALPIALKVILAEMDPSTITFYRFLGSAFVVGAVLGVRGRLPSLRTLDRPVRWMLLAAGTFLCVDYLLYLMSLDRTTPADAQVLIQLGPLLLAMGGLLFFREKFGLGQWVGFATLLAGLGVFFRSQLGAVAADLAGHDQYPRRESSDGGGGDVLGLLWSGAEAASSFAGVRADHVLHLRRLRGALLPAVCAGPSDAD